MSIKDWKNNEISGLLAEAWGFKFNTLQEFEEFNEGADKNDGLEPDGDGTSYGHMKEEDEDLDEVAGVATRGTERRKPHKREPVPEDDDDKKASLDEAEGEDEQDDDPAGASETKDGVVSEKQGYDARLDDTLGAKHGKKSQSEKDREHESEGEEKAHGKRKYASDSKMDEGDDADLEEIAAKREGNEDRDAGKDRMHADRMHEEEAAVPALNKEAIRNALREVLLSLKK